jgi:predicted DNA-binding transcriptional regulator YafY
MDNSELSFLIDAIFSSKSIPSNHAKELTKHLMSDCSIYEQKKFDYIHKADEIARTNNKEFFYVIETITRAIEENKQISFTYNEVLPNKQLKTRFNGKEFIINPYFMINNNGKYYLVCNYDKYSNLANYKVECISNVKILDTKIKPMQMLEDTENFEIANYVNEHIYMFSGKTIQATIKIATPKILNDIVDWYGENIIVKQKDDDIFVSFNVNEQAFLYWALQYGMNIEIVKPAATRKNYVEMVNTIKNKYIHQ